MTLRRPFLEPTHDLVGIRGHEDLDRPWTEGQDPAGVALALEVGVEDRPELPPRDGEHDRVARRRQPVGPRAVADAHRVEERLLDDVLLDQREAELPSDGLGERRLARSGRPRDEDQLLQVAISFNQEARLSRSS